MMDAMKYRLKKFAKKYYRDISAIAAIVCIYLIYFAVGIGCPIKFLTGISCAGCGMTRAWWHLLHGDLRQTFYYHPLFWLPIFATFVIILRKRLSKECYHLIWIGIIAVAMFVYICRFFIPNQDIVVFEPQVGFIARLIRFIIGR